MGLDQAFSQWQRVPGSTAIDSAPATTTLGGQIVIAVKNLNHRISVTALSTGTA
jgi:hypothetical protein